MWGVAVSDVSVVALGQMGVDGVVDDWHGLSSAASLGIVGPEIRIVWMFLLLCCLNLLKVFASGGQKALVTYEGRRF